MSSRRTTTTSTVKKSTTGTTKKAAPPPPPKPGTGRRGSKKDEEIPKKEAVRKSSTSSSSSTSSAAAAAAGASPAAAPSSPRTPPPVSPRTKTLPRDLPPPDASVGAAGVPRTPEEPKEETEYDRALKKQMENEEEDYKKIQQEIRDRCQAAMEVRSSDLAAQFDYTYNNTFRGMEDRYSGQLKGKIDTKQTDVLRTNKVFREIGRGLGEDWPDIFRMLMKAGSTTQTENEIDRITAMYRPHMQPYNALLEWKKEMGEDFHMQPLIEALRSTKQYDLAEKAMDIMEARGEGLMRVDCGRGQASVTRPRPSSMIANGDNMEAAAMGNFEGMEYIPRIVEKKEQVADPISDANLLKLARQMGERWTSLAEHISIPQEDLETIIANEGTDYSGGFRMLWVWRDSLDGSEGPEANAKKLGKALHHAGFKDLAENFVR